MYHSRDIADLRADVRANCVIFLDLCKEAGLPVLVTETVRDDEYQRYLAANGYAAKTATRPTFHGVKAGLAFDICKNVKGHEYDDPSFFARCGQIGKQVGFSWGGDWKKFPDRPHLQWDDHMRYTGSMILAGKYPPEMEEYMDQTTFNRMMDAYLAQLGTKPVSSWAAKDWAAAKAAGITDGSAPQRLITRQEVVTMIQRAANNGARFGHRKERAAKAHAQAPLQALHGHGQSAQVNPRAIILYGPQAGCGVYLIV